MTTIKKLQQIYSPPAQAGFLGRGHIARPVIQLDFSESDPFIMLMDDMLDKKDDAPAGGPHPHAGFETVTLMLEGEIGEGPDKMKAGDFEMMTAGAGVVHTETITKQTKLRILQLWLNLPKKDRWAKPRVQKLSAAHTPSRSDNGVTVRTYSGSFFGLSSPVLNHTPMILAEIKIEEGKSLRELLPGAFTTFIYVLEGSVQAGEEKGIVTKDQVGWFDRADESLSTLLLEAGDEGARLVLYSAEPQRHEIVSYGPFIADSMDEIRNLYADYRNGKIGHIHDVSESQKILL
ncbi:MAG TPA: pirin-like C-terminal cupin domain-containing protein [Chryseolinea sp.]|nr:pirin-like C-terminal cupin domain-containing protein [Chryseolinea sp.]